MREHSGGCSLAIGSITQAMRAQSVLGGAAIPTTVIKYDNVGQHSKGCVYGLSFSCLQKNNVEKVLEGARIRVKQWNTES